MAQMGERGAWRVREAARPRARDSSGDPTPRAVAAPSNAPGSAGDLGGKHLAPNFVHCGRNWLPSNHVG